MKSLPKPNDVPYEPSWHGSRVQCHSIQQERRYHLALRVLNCCKQRLAAVLVTCQAISTVTPLADMLTARFRRGSLVGEVQGSFVAHVGELLLFLPV